MLPSITKYITFGFLGFLFITNIYAVKETNSFFSAKSSISDNKVSAGYWLPELEYTVSPPAPNGKNGWYKTHPCVTLKTNDLNGDVKIYYEFYHDGNPILGGQLYSGTCVSIPEGEWDFQAQAVNKKGDSEWKSNLVSLHFKVDTTKPCKPVWHFPCSHICKDLKTCLRDFWHDQFFWDDKIEDVSGIAQYIFEEKEPGSDSDWYEPYFGCGLIKNNFLPTSERCFKDKNPTEKLKNGVFQRRIKAIDEAGNESDWSDIWDFEIDINDSQDGSQERKHEEISVSSDISPVADNNSETISITPPPPPIIGEKEVVTPNTTVLDNPKLPDVKIKDIKTKQKKKTKKINNKKKLKSETPTKQLIF